MSRSFRVVDKAVSGRSRHNFNFPDDPFFKSRNLAINVTAGEVKPAISDSAILGDTKRNFVYHLGEANVWVSNISPHFEDHFRGEASGVEFILNVDNREPLAVAYTVTVDEDRIIETQGF